MVHNKLPNVVHLSESAFHALSFSEKQQHLPKLAPKERMELMLDDPDARRLVASMEPQQFFWLVKEIGENDALGLLQLASPEQSRFVLDLELWQGWNFSQEKACHWLGYFLEGGEPRVHSLLQCLDFEFLQLFLGRELLVGGGIGDLDSDELRQMDYDHTFDGTFMLKFKNPQHSQLIGAFVEMLMKLDHPLYVSLMESIQGGIETELEEQCLRFRNGRMEDLGFPALEEALSIYARVNPVSFELLGDKVLEPGGETTALVPVSADLDTLLFRALAAAQSPELAQELNYLVNSALVAEGAGFDDPKALVAVVQRVCGYLNLALEKLCGADVQQAADLLVHERLKRLFQLGYSLVLELKSAAERQETVDYASGKLLSGLKAKRPRFYCGLDPEGTDGYREFRDLSDVNRVAEILNFEL
jgi:hypothetical protein